MGNEISTVGGAIATVGTSVAVGVTFGQIDSVNNAAMQCAKFTGNAAANTTVRHVGETVGTAAATAGATVAAGVTLGQVDDGTPLIGHIKGGIHYACGDKESGEKAMKSASRTTGVIAGGVVGIPGGPAGMVVGGIAGGAAMDGITTGVESTIKGNYIPSGSFKAWNDVAEGKDAQTVVGGVVGGIMTPVMDGMGGYTAGKAVVKMKAGPVPRKSNHALNRFMAEQQKTSSFKSAISNLSKQSSLWAHAVQQTSDHGSIITIADIKSGVMYRGVRKGMSPFEAGGHESELGPGMYFTDSLKLVMDYATADPNTGRRVLGDVYVLRYDGNVFKDFSKYWTTKNGVKVKLMIRPESYQIIKTSHGGINQYRISPDFAFILEQTNSVTLYWGYTI